MTTEGDAFTMVFHDAIDAVHWALATQIALLQAPWPSALLEHPKACEEWYMSKHSTQECSRALDDGLEHAVGTSPACDDHACVLAPCMSMRPSRAS